MIAPVALIIFAAILVMFGPVLLRRSTWLEQSPRIGIAAWQVLSIALVLTALLAGLALAVPTIPWTTHLAELVRSCAMALRAQYSTPGGALISTIGAFAALAILARIAYFLITGLASAAHNTRQQLQNLAIVAKPHRDYNALVVEHSSAAAYCLPGRHHRVVLTSAALTVLDHNQLAAVLAHEQAHLRGHHHLILVVADALQHAFPTVSIFYEARIALGRLVEMLADDNAAQRSDRLTVATALVRLAEHGMTPVAALGASGDSTLNRVRRLVAPVKPLGAGKTVVAVIATSVLLILPLSFAIAPASAAGTMRHCSLDNSSNT